MYFFFFFLLINALLKIFRLKKSYPVKLPRYVRINTLLTNVNDILDAFCDDEWNFLPRCNDYATHLETVSNLNMYDFIQDFHIPEVLVFSPGTKFYNHPAYLNGKLILQDKVIYIYMQIILIDSFFFSKFI